MITRRNPNSLRNFINIRISSEFFCVLNIKLTFWSYNKKLFSLNVLNKYLELKHVFLYIIGLNRLLLNLKLKNTFI